MEKEHAEGRVLFWIHHFIDTGEHNGELKKAWEEFEAAESKKKEFDRNILAEVQLNMNR